MGDSAKQEAVFYGTVPSLSTVLSTVLDGDGKRNKGTERKRDGRVDRLIWVEDDGYS